MTRTRFAPSPTGYLHVGGVRTALFAWLVARQASGEFVLRIEDTDRERHVEKSESHIKDSLEWLGLIWDEGPDKKGPFGPYRQSERLPIYEEWAEKLIKEDRAYADPFSKEELEELRNKASKEKRPFLFREHRPQNPPEWSEGKPLRFKSEPKSYEWHDEVMGDLSVGPEAIDDFILLKADGFPTYNFAHVIDDQLMKVTHVIRSQEFLPSVPKFLNLYEALKIERPKLVTLPYVLGHDGNKKLSKRDGAKDILDYKNDGYLPEALTSFLATLGWHDGTDQEIFTIDELIKKFNLDRVQKSGARFDQDRLDWVNGHFIRQMTVGELYEQCGAFWPEAAKAFDEPYKKDVLKLLQDRLKYLAELKALSSFFFDEPKDEEVLALYRDPVDKQLKKMEQEELKAMLQAAADELGESNFSADDIASRLNLTLEKQKTKPAVLFPIIRIAISGQKATPELFGTLATLGKEKSMARIAKALELLEKA